MSNCSICGDIKEHHPTDGLVKIKWILCPDGWCYYEKKESPDGLSHLFREHLFGIQENRQGGTITTN